MLWGIQPADTDARCHRIFYAYSTSGHSHSRSYAVAYAHALRHHTDADSNARPLRWTPLPGG